MQKRSIYIKIFDIHYIIATFQIFGIDRSLKYLLNGMSVAIAIEYSMAFQTNDGNN